MKSLTQQINALTAVIAADMVTYATLDPTSDQARTLLARLMSDRDTLATLQQQYANGPEAIADANLGLGISVISTGTPSLNGTYPCDDLTTLDVTAELLSIILNGTFVDGNSTVQWANAQGIAQTMTIAQFKALGTFMGKYVGQNKAAVLATYNGQAANWPTTNVVTIP